MQEMKEVIEHLGYEAAYEEKAYPRDLTQFGRFRVLLKDPQTGEPKVEGIESRRQLLMKLAELIPAAHSGSASSGPRSSAAQTFAEDRGRSTVVPSMFDLVSHQLRLMCTDIWLASEVPPPYHYEIDLVLRSERVR